MEEENEGRAKGEALSKIETRVFTNEFEVREDGEGMTLTGYAARFNEPSEPLPFIERIKPGAFKRSINSRNDIKLLWNHNTDMVLGSTRAGTLTLKEDEVGLRVVASLPDTTYGRDAKVSIQRGDVTGFSFGFTVPAGGDSWSSDGSERTLKSVRLMEVSTGVAFPAYPSTNGTAQVRGLDKVAERNNIDADALADALLKIEDGQTISVDEAAMLSRVINDLAPTEEVAQPNGDLGMLALKKKKLDLLIKGI
jgi:HK97 family phage prohead protease